MHRAACSAPRPRPACSCGTPTPRSTWTSPRPARPSAPTAARPTSSRPANILEPGTKTPSLAIPPQRIPDPPPPRGGGQGGARRAMARQLRGRFDTAYVLPNSAKSALLPFLAGIRRRVGYHGEMRYGLLTQRLPNPPRDERPPMVGFYSALAGERGTEADRPRLLLPPAQIDAVLQAHGLARRGFHVFAPGAEFGPSKRWPPGHYAPLAADPRPPRPVLGSGQGQPPRADHPPPPP